MESIIKIKCPYCSSVLSVRNQAGIESKSVTCPICKRKTPFFKFKKVIDWNDDPTQYPEDNERTVYRESSDEPPTEIGKAFNFCLGKLKVLPLGPSFLLKPGRNVIGRKATQSAADFQISTGASKRLSREHVVIDVKKVPGKGFVHYISLCKQKVNATFIDNGQLEFGDCVVLSNGNTIKLPDVNVKFEINDEEETEQDIGLL